MFEGHISNRQDQAGVHAIDTLDLLFRGNEF
jgi:hypothetical protein